MHASPKVALQPDGSALVEFRLSSTTEIKAWVLSFGPAAEVLEPAELRQEIQRDLAAMSALYAGHLALRHTLPVRPVLNKAVRKRSSR
jgi:predicted DNA-binding transcriptional regulator YafY